LDLPKSEQKKREHYAEKPHPWVAAARWQLNTVCILEYILKIPAIQVHIKKLLIAFILDIGS
jgi:hypothetical protein